MPGPGQGGGGNSNGGNNQPKAPTYEELLTRARQQAASEQNAKAQSEDQNFIDHSGVSIYGTPDQRAGEIAGRRTAELYYGSSRDLGRDAADYRARVKAGLDEPSQIANQYMSASNREIGKTSSAARLKGNVFGASRLGEQHAAQAKEAEINQAHRQSALSLYGKAVGAGISGTEAMAGGGSGRGLASTPSPTASYGSGGILSGIFDMFGL